MDAEGMGEIDIRVTHPIRLLKIAEDVLAVITSELVGGETIGIVPLDQGAHITPACIDIEYTPPVSIQGTYRCASAHIGNTPFHN